MSSVLYVSCPACLLSYMSPALYVSCPVCLLSCMSSVLYVSYPVCPLPYMYPALYVSCPVCLLPSVIINFSYVKVPGTGRIGDLATTHSHPDARRRWVKINTLRSLYPQDETRYSLYRRLGGPEDRYGHYGKFRPHWHSIPGRSARSDSLYRIRYFGHLS
jgi:hypothetical protein